MLSFARTEDSLGLSRFFRFLGIATLAMVSVLPARAMTEKAFRSAVEAALTPMGIVYDAKWLKYFEDDLYLDLHFHNIVEASPENIPGIQRELQKKLKARIELCIKEKAGTASEMEAYSTYLTYAKRHDLLDLNSSERFTRYIQKRTAILYFQNPNGVSKEVSTPMLEAMDENEFYQQVDGISKDPGIAQKARIAYFIEQIKLHPDDSRFIGLYIKYTAYHAAPKPLENLEFIHGFFNNYPTGWNLEANENNFLTVLHELIAGTKGMNVPARNLVFEAPNMDSFVVDVLLETSRLGMVGRAYANLLRLAREVEKGELLEPESHGTLSELLAPIEFEEKHEIHLNDSKDKLNQYIEKMIRFRIGFYLRAVPSGLGMLVFKKIKDGNPDLAKVISEKFYRYEFFPNVFKVRFDDHRFYYRPNRPSWESEELKIELMIHFFEEAQKSEAGQFEAAEIEDLLIGGDDDALRLYKPILEKYLKPESVLRYRLELLTTSGLLSSSHYPEVKALLTQNVDLAKNLRGYIKGIALDLKFTNLLDAQPMLWDLLAGSDLRVDLHMTDAEVKETVDEILKSIGPLTSNNVVETKRRMAVSENLLKQYAQSPEVDEFVLEGMIRAQFTAYIVSAEKLKDDPPTLSELPYRQRFTNFFQWVSVHLPRLYWSKQVNLFSEALDGKSPCNRALTIPRDVYKAIDWMNGLHPN